MSALPGEKPQEKKKKESIVVSLALPTPTVIIENKLTNWDLEQLRKGWFHIPKPCKITGCKYVDAPGHDGMCIKHWNRINR